eukprot:13997186-Alexandrium_andersonii.AAC.1
MDTGKLNHSAGWQRIAQWTRDNSTDNDVIQACGLLGHPNPQGLLRREYAIANIIQLLKDPSSRGLPQEAATAH